MSPNNEKGIGTIANRSHFYRLKNSDG